MRSIDGEVVSKLRLGKKNAQQSCAAQNSCSTLCWKEISANEDKARTNGFPFGGAGYTADGEGYLLKMGALRAGNA